MSNLRKFAFKQKNKNSCSHVFMSLKIKGFLFNVKLCQNGIYVNFFS